LGRKVHPYGFRLGIVKDWKARWFAEGAQYTEQLHEDLKIRERVFQEMSMAGVADVELERFPNQVSITVHSSKPGIIIGRKGTNVNKLREGLEALTGKKVRIDVREVKSPDTNARLVSGNIASQLEHRISYRRAMKQAAMRAMRGGAKGIKIMCSGRLSGAEMARTMQVREGRVPLHTLRADIDYALTEAHTTYGAIGVKVWIYNGDILSEDEA